MGWRNPPLLLTHTFPCQLNNQYRYRSLVYFPFPDSCSQSPKPQQQTVWFLCTTFFFCHSSRILLSTTIIRHHHLPSHPRPPVSDPLVQQPPSLHSRLDVLESSPRCHSAVWLGLERIEHSRPPCSVDVFSLLLPSLPDPPGKLMGQNDRFRMRGRDQILDEKNQESF